MLCVCVYVSVYVCVAGQLCVGKYLYSVYVFVCVGEGGVCVCRVDVRICAWVTTLP